MPSAKVKTQARPEPGVQSRTRQAAALQGQPHASFDAELRGSPQGTPEHLVAERARLLGFDAVGFARADLPVDADYARYREFLAQGFHGEMGWLADNAEVRRGATGEGILSGARTVICLARRYQRPRSEEERDPPLARTVARYARGSDYHNHLRRKLRKLASFVRTLGTPEAPVTARPICDDAPILERAWAARAGLGFVGKNGMLIVPGQGSMVLLGEVVTTLALEPGVPMTERCGSCTRCLEACPTGAFPRPFVLDPRRCIAYLTIELRSETPEPLREGVGEHLFGCDDCQTVCPFNASTKRFGPVAASPFDPLEAFSTLELTELLALRDDEDEATRAFWTRIAGSPLRRAGGPGLARNAALVLGNRGDEGAVPALRRAAAEHPFEMVRRSAAWALQRILQGQRENTGMLPSPGA